MATILDAYGRPTAVKIGPHWYRILYSKESWKKYAPKQRKNNYGVTISDHGVILLNTSRLNTSQMRDTLLHEIMHAVFALHNFSNLPIEFPDPDNVEELVILLLCPSLLQVLQDNVELREWLLVDNRTP